MHERDSLALAQRCNEKASIAPCQILDTKAGSLFLQDHCPAVVVERWSAESGLHAFARPRADAARAFGEPAHAVSRRVSHAAHGGSPSLPLYGRQGVLSCQSQTCW